MGRGPDGLVEAGVRMPEVRRTPMSDLADRLPKSQGEDALRPLTLARWPRVD